MIRNAYGLEVLLPCKPTLTISPCAATCTLNIVANGAAVLQDHSIASPCYAARAAVTPVCANYVFITLANTAVHAECVLKIETDYNKV